MISLLKTWMPKLYIPKLWPHSCWRNFLFNVFSWSGNIPRASKIQVNATKKDNRVSMSWLLNLDTVEFFFWLTTVLFFSSAPLHETFGRGGALKLPSIFQVGLLFKKKKRRRRKQNKGNYEQGNELFLLKIAGQYSFLKRNVLTQSSRLDIQSLILGIIW